MVSNSHGLSLQAALAQQEDGSKRLTAELEAARQQLAARETQVAALDKAAAEQQAELQRLREQATERDAKASALASRRQLQLAPCT
jgi:predicted  nucleic acid-binding Zn-ribbon protein